MSKALRTAALLATIGGILGGLPGPEYHDSETCRDYSCLRCNTATTSTADDEESFPAEPGGAESRQVRRARERAEAKERDRRKSNALIADSSPISKNERTGGRKVP